MVNKTYYGLLQIGKEMNNERIYEILGHSSWLAANSGFPHSQAVTWSQQTISLIEHVLERFAFSVCKKKFQQIHHTTMNTSLKKKTKLLYFMICALSMTTTLELSWSRTITTKTKQTISLSELDLSFNTKDIQKENTSGPFKQPPNQDQKQH